MAKFCTACGKSIPDGVAFCTECGTKAPCDHTEINQTTTKATLSPVRDQGQPYYQQSQQVYQQPLQPTHVAPPRPLTADESGGVVGTGTFLGMMLLFALPIVGFIALIIMCFVPKRKSIKNYAKATIIWGIVSIVVVVAVIFLFGSMLMGYLNELTNESFASLPNIW